MRIPGISLKQAVAQQHDVDSALATFPEVERVFSRMGTDEVANDVMPPNLGDTFVILTSLPASGQLPLQRLYVMSSVFTSRAPMVSSG